MAQLNWSAECTLACVSAHPACWWEEPVWAALESRWWSRGQGGRLRGQVQHSRQRRRWKWIQIGLRIGKNYPEEEHCDRDNDQNAQRKKIPGMVSGRRGSGGRLNSFNQLK